MHETNFFDALIEICIIFLIIFMPLAFGAVGIGSQIIFISICELMFFLWLVKSVNVNKENIEFSISVFHYVFAAILALFIIQIIPLPKFLLNLLSPNTYKDYMDFLPGYKDNFMWRSISFSTKSTKIEFFKIISYCIVIFVIIRSIGKKQQITRILTAISVSGFVIACFGILQKLTSNGMIYWIVPVPENSGVFGPFVNRNHFAGFAELIIPISAAMVFITDKIEKRILFAFMSTVMLLALFLSLSRAGIISLFAAMGIVFIAVSLRRSLKRYFFYIIPLFLFIVISVFFLTKGLVIARFLQAPQALGGRLHLYKDILKMFMDFPLFGIGQGNFTNVFAMYDTSVAGAIVNQGESDWVQFLAESGLTGFFIALIFAWIFFKDILFCHFLGKGRCTLSKDIDLPPCEGKRHDKFVLLIISAGLVSVISIMLHGIVDINLHIPSNMLLACVIGALLVTTAHTKFKEKEDDSK